jgi:hypothetical protein
MPKLHSKKSAIEHAHVTMMEIFKHQPQLLASTGERSLMLYSSDGLAGKDLAQNIKALHDGLTQMYLEMEADE